MLYCGRWLDRSNSRLLSRESSWLLEPSKYIFTSNALSSHIKLSCIWIVFYAEFSECRLVKVWLWFAVAAAAAAATENVLCRVWMMHHMMNHTSVFIFFNRLIFSGQWSLQQWHKYHSHRPHSAKGSRIGKNQHYNGCIMFSTVEARNFKLCLCAEGSGV